MEGISEGLQSRKKKKGSNSRLFCGDVLRISQRAPLSSATVVMTTTAIRLVGLRRALDRSNSNDLAVVSYSTRRVCCRDSS